MTCGTKMPRILATFLGTSISMPRSPLTARPGAAPSTFPKEYYLRNLTIIPLCDHLSSDFQSRFNSENRKGVGILALLPAVITGTYTQELVALSIPRSTIAIVIYILMTLNSGH